MKFNNKMLGRTERRSRMLQNTNTDGYFGRLGFINYYIADKVIKESIFILLVYLLEEI